MSVRKVAVLAMALAATAMVHAQEFVPEPDEYRTDNYRAPVPTTLKEARVLTTVEAKAIWHEKRGTFIDVLPRPPKPANLPLNTVWRDKPRRGIPGSLWLPDTGYGRLAIETEAYLQEGLVRASAGRRDALLVVYCQSQCWMSWNVAKRALSYGYTNIAWYPEGTDGWEQADLPLVDAQPELRSVLAK